MNQIFKLHFIEDENALFQRAAVTAVASFALILYIAGVFKGIEHSRAYLMNISSYIWAITFIFFIYTITAIIKPLRKYSAPLLFILAILTGYFFAEILYRYFPSNVPDFITSLLGQPASFHLENYFFHRLYQIIPLIGVILLLCSYKNGYFSNYLKFGNFNVKTDLFGREKNQTWGSAVFKIILEIIVVLSIVAAVFYYKSKGFHSFNLTLILPIALYAFWNCLVEESLFRGILLPVFEKSFTCRTAIILQAILFGFVHFDPSNIIFSIIRALLFVFLGWLFGKATKETEGIGASWLIHTTIVLAIEMRILLQ